MGKGDVRLAVIPPPSSAFGEVRKGRRYAPTLKSRDYKDPLWVVTVYEQRTESV